MTSKVIYMNCKIIFCQTVYYSNSANKIITIMDECTVQSFSLNENGSWVKVHKGHEIVIWTLDRGVVSNKVKDIG